jgi:hypothetical protein
VGLFIRSEAAAEEAADTTQTVEAAAAELVPSLFGISLR